MLLILDQHTMQDEEEESVSIVGKDIPRLRDAQQNNGNIFIR